MSLHSLLILGKIEKWLKEGEVELKVTRINMHGAPGAGKTCSQRLLLNEPPPEKPTDSTPIACRAVQATRISIDDKNKWERVKREDLLNQLASHLKEAPKEAKHGNLKLAHTLCLIIVFCYNFVKNSRIGTFVSKFVQRPNEQPKNKLSETEVVIKTISNALKTGKSKKLSTNWVYFIDSGGQPAYRELLPLFTRAAALNIITIDLNKGLDKKCKFQYRTGQHMSPIDTDLKSNRDIIRSTISSEAMLNPVKIPYVSVMPEHSHYLILGTHEDLVTKEKLEEMNESLKEYRTNKKVIPYNEHFPRNKHQGSSIIFPVDTLSAGKKRETASEDLCTRISKYGVAMTIKLPIRLFTFEISLLMKAEKEERSFLTKKEVIEIGKSLRLDDESDIDDALQYLHNVTIILYYPAVLPNLIFVDPEPILDVLSHLIAITYVNNADPIEDTPSFSEGKNLREFGLFKKDLLNKIGKKIFNKDLDFESSHMITLLKDLHIIAEVKNEEEKGENKEGKIEYFFPCALPSYDALNPAPTEIQPLLIAWEIKNSGTTTLAIPQGLFPLTIVHLLEKKNEVEFVDPKDPYNRKEFYRCHDAMSLRIYKKYFIDIINCYEHLEIHVRGPRRDNCPQIRKLVSKAIKESSKDLKLKEDNKFVFAFKCCHQENCIVQEDNCSTSSCTHFNEPCDLLQSGDDSYGCWFSDCQIPSQG